MTPIHTNSHAGIEIFNFLKDKLGLPANVTSLDVHIGLDKLIEVKCTFYPSYETVSDHDYK